MEHKEASEILIEMIKKETLTEREKEAINTAIGVLGWTMLAHSRIKNLGAKNKINKGLLA